MSAMSSGVRRLVLALALMGAMAAGLALVAWLWVDRPLDLAAERIELSIEPGTTPREVAEGWVRSGVLTRPEFLYRWFQWSGQARRIRAGSYVIDAGTTPRKLLDKMVQGDETFERLLLVEGWTLRQVRKALADAPHLVARSAGMGDAELMRAIGAGDTSGEGAFFPDTYVYGRGVSDLTVLARAHRAMQQRLEAAWAQRAPNLPLKTPDEALILASIVEKETGPKDDPAMVAAVFVNRLRLGMPLQTDPTVIYGLGEAFDGNLRKRDLQADTPYNTYTRAGLPPTPIAMPGQASLLAAVRPAQTKVLYFVARGDGSSVFSDNLADHNRAVQKYQKQAR